MWFGFIPHGKQILDKRMIVDPCRFANLRAENPVPLQRHPLSE
jgi:hypothetical protein